MSVVSARTIHFLDTVTVHAYGDVDASEKGRSHYASSRPTRDEVKPNVRRDLSCACACGGGGGRGVGPRDDNPSL